MNRKTLNLIFDRDNFYLYPWYFSDEVLAHDIKKVFGKKVSQIVIEYKKGHIYYYVNIDEINAIGKDLLEKVKNDREFYKTVQKNILSSGEELMIFCQKINKLEIEKLSDRQLVEMYLEYAVRLKKVRVWGWVPPLIDGMETYFLTDYLTEQFKVFLEKSGSQKKFAEYFSVLSSADKMSEVQKEELDRLKMIVNIEKNDKEIINIIKEKSAEEVLKILISDHPVFYEKIKKHTKEYEWLTYGYIGPVMNEIDVIDLMKSSLGTNESAKKQIREIENRYKNLSQGKKKIIKLAKLSSDLKYLFEIYSFFMYLKDLRKGIYQKSYVAVDKVINEISARAKLTVKEVKYLTSEEIKKALSGKIKKTEVKKRTVHSMFLVEKGKTKLLSEKEIENIKKQIISKKVDVEVKEISGSVAFSGKVTARVKIIHTVADIPKLKEGEILVSSSTNPDLVPAMKIASAFITDMGGITCHAAIVSREMKKPCIVGTKIATKVLKDGDLVEMDANTGVVTILK